MIAVGLFLLGSPSRADDFANQVKSALPALLKVLAYDINFDARGVGKFTVLVVSDPSQSERRQGLMAAAKELGAQKVKTRPVEFASVDFKDEPTLQGEIDRVKAAAILVVPGTSPATVQHVWEVVQDNQIYALALEAAMVEQTIPVGVQAREGRPQIVINEKASRSVGAKFESSVLKVARVIQ